MYKSGTHLHSRWLVLVVIMLLVIGGMIALWGTDRVGTLPGFKSDYAKTVSQPQSIDLSQEEPMLPPGRYQEICQQNCIACHSTRLILTQPKLTPAQWKATVHKMVDKYGAPIDKIQEEQISDYLITMSTEPMDLSSR